MKQIVMVHLGVYGDALYATTIAQQIKKDNPGCNLTWVIGRRYRDILNLNPHVDNVVAIDEVKNRLDVKGVWKHVHNVMETTSGDYDELYFTQIYPGYPDDFKDCLRAAMFRRYKNPITVPLDPVVVLSNAEVERVWAFAEHHHLSSYKNIVLFECSPQSGQNSLTAEDVNKIAVGIATDISTCVVMSGEFKTSINHPRIIDASILTFRENAELTKYCTLLLGMGSGITQICQSTWAKKLPTIQLLEKHSVASLIADHTHFGLDTSSIIEIPEPKPEWVVACTLAALYRGFAAAKSACIERVEPDYNILRFHMRFDNAMMSGRYFDIIPALITTIQDYGVSAGLLYFLSTFPKSIIRILTRHS